MKDDTTVSSQFGPLLPANKFTPAQVTYLDLVRGLAALFAAFGHAGYEFMAGTWFASGVLQTLGVVAFFLISGFLLTSSVLTRLGTEGYNFTSYVIDRFFRFFTPFVPALVLVALLDAHVAAESGYRFGRDYNVSTWFANLLMLQDYPMFQVLRRLGVADQWWMFASFGSARTFWTVAIGWWLSLLLGFVVFGVLLRRAASAFTLLAVGAVLAVVPGYHFVGGWGECLTMVWMIGMAAAYLHHTQPSILARYPQFAANLALVGRIAVAFGVLCMAARLFANRGQLYELQFALFFALSLFGALLILGVRRGPVAGVIRAPIAFVARFSYSLYLVHFTVIAYLGVRFPGHGNDPVMYGTAIAASILVAIVFWFLFERHHRTLADLAKARVRQVAAPVAVQSGAAAD